MRTALPILFVAFGAGCSATALELEAPTSTLETASATERLAPLTPFTPPVPAGCASAADYDGCFAFDGATPLEVVAHLPATLADGAVVTARFHRIDRDDAPAEPAQKRVLVAENVQFRVPADDTRRDVRLYFQVFAGRYQIELGVDAHGGGTAGTQLRGWSATSDDAPVREQADAAIVEVAVAPVSTSLLLALPQ